jgi:hypothetical protein
VTRLRLPWRRRGPSPARIAYVSGYAFPGVLREKLREEHPDLTEREAAAVLEGLRAWFMVALHADGATIGMPSRVVDDAWHTFILLTRHYAEFCDEAFGRFLHHAPTELLDTPTEDGLRRTLHIAESLPPHLLAGAAGAMVLFTIDEELGIEGGHTYPQSFLEQLRQSDGASASAGCSAGWDSDAGGGGCGGGDGGGGGGCGGS